MDVVFDKSTKELVLTAKTLEEKTLLTSLWESKFVGLEMHEIQQGYSCALKFKAK